MSSEPITYVLTVNGDPETVTAAPDATLVEVLRDTLHLTGAKTGCAQGVCGTCTVLVGGRPARGCLTLAADCADRPVTTVEGLAKNGALTAVQDAFIEGGAIQCGFCTSGMILTVTALLRDNPKPTKTEIREAVSGNLCRCSGYSKIIEAAERAAGSAA